MVQARNYLATEVLRDGCTVDIRALKPEDLAACFPRPSGALTTRQNSLEAAQATRVHRPETLTRAFFSSQEVSMAYTLSEVTESIGTITLDHERRRNALSHALVEEIIAAFRSFQDTTVRVVMLRAKPGVKVFSAGHGH